MKKDRNGNVFITRKITNEDIYEKIDSLDKKVDLHLKVQKRKNALIFGGLAVLYVAITIIFNHIIK